jgi:ABC-type transport system substrate-binding protein
VKGHAEFVAGTAPEISGIVAQDDRTLVLELSKPDVTILNVVAIPPFYVMAKEEVEKAGDKVSSTPVGAGPYKLAEWDDNGRTFTAQRFENYVYADKVPYLDTLEHQWGVSEDVRYLKVSRNEADLTLDVPASAIPRIKQDPQQSERFAEWSSFSIAWWEFDVTKPPFDDVLVRQAFNYAFDRERAAPLGFRPTGSFFPPDLLGAEESAPAYTYDPDRAKELLAEAGADGLELTLPVLDSGLASNGRLAQLLQQDLKAVGVTVTLEQVADTPYDIGAELPNRYRLWNMGWGMGLPDPSELTSSLIGTGAPSNYGGYSNPKIDELAAQALGEADRDARGALYAEVEEILLEDAPFLFFGVNVRTTFASEPLQNVLWTPVLWTFWDRLWKDA